MPGNAGALRARRWLDVGRGLLWLAATAIASVVILSLWAPPLGGRAAFKPARVLASLLYVPRVLAPLGPEAGDPGRGVRRIRLRQTEGFGVAVAGDLNDGTFAYIDGVQVPFQGYEPDDPGPARAMVFARSPAGESLFVVCGIGSECRQAALIARRERLVWALRVTRMPGPDALGALLSLVAWMAVTWRLRHFNLSTLRGLGRRLSLLGPAPTEGEPSPRGARSGLTVDLALGLGLAVLGAAAAREEFARDFTLGYYQPEFGPAINVALGRGFAPFSEAELTRNPGIEDFLRGRADAIGHLDLDAEVSPAGLNQFQRAERYMMIALGWTWRVVGISHPALFVPWCVTVGLTVLTAFMFARTCLGRAAAAFTAFVFLYAPATLQLAHSPRDFLKAPFVFLFLAFAGRCAVRWEERAGLWAMGAGLALGLGSGFRMDVLVIAPLFPVVLWLRYRARKDVAGPALMFAVSLLITGWPIGSALLDGSNASHVSMLGQVPDFWTEAGGFQGANQWNALEGYEDSHVVGLSQVAAAARGIPPPDYSTAGYDRLVGSVLREQVSWAPADLVSKVIQTQAVLWELPTAPSDAGWLRLLQRPWRAWAGWIWLLAIAAVFLRRPGRYALVFLTFLIAVACSWLQLSPRHLFHWLPVALVVQLSAVQWGLAAARRLWRRDRRERPSAWAGCAIVIAFVAPAVVLAAGRAQQSRIRQGLARDLLSGAGADIAPVRAGSILKYATALGPPAAGSSAYAVLAVDWTRCPARSIEVKWGIEIEAEPARYRLVPGPPGQPGPSYVIHLRAFMRERPSYFFVPLDAEACVTVRELPLEPDFPILWSVVLTPGWENGDHNLRFADELPALDPRYRLVPQSASLSGDGLRIFPQAPAGDPGGGTRPRESVGARVEYEQAGSPGTFRSPPLVAGPSGRYRFEFEIEGGGEWRASVDDPDRTDRFNGVAVGERSLAHPAGLLMRPLRLTRRVALDEWLDSDDPVRLYLRSVDEEKSVSVSRFRVSLATPPEQR